MTPLARPLRGEESDPVSDPVMAALRSARPVLDPAPDPAAPESTAMLAAILATPTGARSPVASPARPTRLRRRWTIGVPAGLAAAVVAVVVLSPAGGVPAGGGQAAAPSRVPIAPSAPLSPSETALRVAVLAAFDTSADKISHTVSTLTATGEQPSTLEVWSCPALPKPGDQVVFRSLLSRQGRPVQDTEIRFTMPASTGDPARDAKVQTLGESIDVEYGSRTWSDQRRTPVSTLTDQGAAAVRQRLAAGGFSVSGPLTLDGRTAIELTWSALPGTTSQLWVDASSYVPLKSSVSSRVGNADQSFTSTSVTSYDYLTASDANRALLTATAPPGFRRTTAPDTRPGG
ncbi:hypothetical protein [Streptacidiphilus sp. PAMC 29251]